MKLFLLAGGLMAMALSLLGDDLTHWLIRAVFAKGMVVIVPLTLSGWLQPGWPIPPTSVCIECSVPDALA